MTQENCIPTDSMMIGDDYSILNYNSGIGAYVELDKMNLVYFVGKSYAMSG